MNRFQWYHCHKPHTWNIPLGLSPPRSPHALECHTWYSTAPRAYRDFLPAPRVIRTPSKRSLLEERWTLLRHGWSQWSLAIYFPTDNTRNRGEKANNTASESIMSLAQDKLTSQIEYCTSRSSLRKIKDTNNFRARKPTHVLTRRLSSLWLSSPRQTASQVSHAKRCMPSCTMRDLCRLAVVTTLNKDTYVLTSGTATSLAPNTEHWYSLPRIQLDLQLKAATCRRLHSHRLTIVVH